MPFRKLFNEHPKSVGETYLEHMRAALWFSTTMARAAFFCLVHAFLPFLFTKTGSSEIERLYEAMVKARSSYTHGSESSADSGLGAQGSLNH
ncbi:MAG: DUF6356 family protein [Candidatus Rariloculaceae bacterium]